MLTRIRGKAETRVIPASECKALADDGQSSEHKGGDVMAQFRIEIDADAQELLGVVDRLRHHDNGCLSKDNLNIVRKDLLNFVHRVASSPYTRQGEIEILPAIAELLLRQFGS